MFTSELLAASNLTRFLSGNSAMPTEATTKQVDKEIELNGVGYTYPNNSTPVLTDVTMYFRTGELVGLVGENGAGKRLCAI